MKYAAIQPSPEADRISPELIFVTNRDGGQPSQRIIFHRDGEDDGDGRDDDSVGCRQVWWRWNDSNAAQKEQDLKVGTDTWRQGFYS